jgi:hypothetical protein
VSDTIAIFSGGLNVHFTPATQLKTQVSRSILFNEYASSSEDPERHNTTILFSRLVLAY